MRPRAVSLLVSPLAPFAPLTPISFLARTFLSVVPENEANARAASFFVPDAPGAGEGRRTSGNRYDIARSPVSAWPNVAVDVPVRARTKRKPPRALKGFQRQSHGLAERKRLRQPKLPRAGTAFPSRLEELPVEFPAFPRIPLRPGELSARNSKRTGSVRSPTARDIGRSPLRNRLSGCRDRSGEQGRDYNVHGLINSTRPPAIARSYFRDWRSLTSSGGGGSRETSSRRAGDQLRLFPNSLLASFDTVGPNWHSLTPLYALS